MTPTKYELVRIYEYCMAEQPKVRRTDLVEPELSYKIVGAVFDVFNQLGSGLRESTYQKGVASALARQGLSFKEQVYCPISYNGKRVGCIYLDFLVDSRVILELKRGEYFARGNIQQVNEYLKVMELPLAILANITQSGVKFRRIVNIQSSKENSYIRKDIRTS